MFTYPLPSPVFRQGQMNSLFSQKYSYQTLPRTPYWLDETPAIGSPAPKSSSKETLLVSPFELMHGRPIMPPGLTSQPSPLPDYLLTLLLLCLHTLLQIFTHHHLPQPHPDPLPSAINIRDLVLLSPPGHNPLPLSPEWTGPFKVILNYPNCH